MGFYDMRGSAFDRSRLLDSKYAKTKVSLSRIFDLWAKHCSNF